MDGSKSAAFVFYVDFNLTEQLPAVPLHSRSKPFDRKPL